MQVPFSACQDGDDVDYQSALAYQIVEVLLFKFEVEVYTKEDN